MKLGPFEGTAEELRDVVQNHGLDIEALFERPGSSLAKLWLILPSVAFALVCLLIWILEARLSVTIGLAIVGVLFATWASASVQLKFKNGLATSCVAVGGLLVLLLSCRVMPLRETIDIAKQFRPGTK
jgi:hypothetical protein